MHKKDNNNGSDLTMLTNLYYRNKVQYLSYHLLKALHSLQFAENKNQEIDKAVELVEAHGTEAIPLMMAYFNCLVGPNDSVKENNVNCSHCILNAIKRLSDANFKLYNVVHKNIAQNNSDICFKKSYFDKFAPYKLEKVLTKIKNEE